MPYGLSIFFYISFSFLKAKSMNKIFKIVFNAARGKMMVVNETTSSVQTGKKAAVTVAVVATLASGVAMAADADYQSLSKSNYGGAINSNAALVIDGKVFDDNHAKGQSGTVYNGGQGGAIYSTADLTVSDSKFNANKAHNGSAGSSQPTVTKGGAIYHANAQLEVTGSEFTSNTSENNGGAIAAYGPTDDTVVIIANSEFVANDTKQHGGAVHVQGANSTLSGNTFTENTAGGRGGAVLFRDNAVATFEGENTFVGNAAGTNGGAINTHQSGAVVTFAADSKTTFQNNTAVKGGGAIRNDDQVTFEEGSEVTFIGNEAANGGAIANMDEDKEAPVLSLNGTSLFENNKASSNGGAIYNAASGQLTIAGSSEFNGNTASGSGGAIYTLGDATLDNAQFLNNSATMGGAILAKGDLTIEDSTFTGSSASWSGAIDAYGDTTISNTAFEKNSAKNHGGAIYNNSGATLLITDGTTFSENKAQSGGAISNEATVNITASTNGAISFTNNEVTKSGGAIFNSGSGQLALQNVKFNDNSALDGGAIYSKGSVTTQGGEFSNNSAGASGGAISSEKSLNLSKTTFSENKAENYGGAVATLGGLVADGVKFESNSAYSGGAIADFNNSSGTMEVKAESVFYQNSAVAEGGAISVLKHLSVVDSDFIENEVAGRGGAISIGSVATVNLENTEFVGNQAGEHGGAIMTRHGSECSDNSKAKLTISGATFEQNSAGKEGGAIHNSFKDTIISSTSFDGNVAGEAGGAIYNHWNGGKDSPTRASMTLIDSSFANNTAKDGGAIYTSGKLTLEETNTFEGNKASAHGGAIYNTGKYGNLTVDNATFSGNKVENTAGGETHGGAIYNYGGKVDIANSTFEGNSAYYVKNGQIDYSQGHGGAIYSRVAGSELTITDSKFTGNKTGKLGGAIYVSETKIDLVGNTFDGNEANAAGVMYVNQANSTFTNNTFTNNKALTGEAGAISFQDGKNAAFTATFKGENTFTGNSAVNGNGGALMIHNYYDVGLTVDFDSDGKVVFDQNTAKNGGAIYNKATLNLANAEFTNNTASDKGGAIYNEGTVTLKGKNTFSGNKAAEGNDIYNVGTLKIEGTTTLDSGMVSTGTVEVDGKLALGGTNEVAQLQLTEGSNLTVGGTANVESLQWEGSTLSLGGEGGTLVTGQDFDTYFGDGETLAITGNLTLESTVEDKMLSIADGGALTSTGDFATTMNFVNRGTTTIDGNATFADVDFDQGVMNLNGEQNTFAYLNVHGQFNSLGSVTAQTMEVDEGGKAVIDKSLTVEEWLCVEQEGEVDATGDLTAQGLYVENGKVTVGGDLTTSEDFLVQTSDSVATIGGDLTVAGNVQNFGTVTVGGNVVVEEAFANGDYEYEGQNVVTIDGTATVGGDFYQGGVNSVTTIGGNATFAANVDVDQGVLNLNGDANVVKGGLVVDGELNSKGALTAQTMYVDDGKVTIAGDLTIGDKYEQDGDSVATIDGNVTVATEMELENGILNLNGEENVIKGHLDIEGELNAKGSVAAQTMSVMEGKAVIANSLTVEGLLEVGYSELSVGSETAVNTFGDIVAAGSRLDVTGAMNTVGDLKLYGGGNGNVVTFTGNNTVASIWVTEDRHPEDVDSATTYSLRSMRSASSVINFSGSTTIEGTTEAPILNVEGSIVHGGNVNTGSYNAEGATITLNGDENNFGDFNGTGSTLNLSDDSTTGIDSFSGSDNTINLTSLNQLTVGEDNASNTTINATGEMNDALGGNVGDLSEQLGLSGNFNIASGDVFGEVTGVVEDGKVVSQEMKKHETNQQIADLSTAVPAMIARVEANDLRKRMGDIRAAEGTHGAWARYDGGKFSGVSGFENTFNKVQVGIDTVPEVGAPRFGVAFSYAKGDVDMTGGSADTQSYSLAAYGIWMGESGQFVDVIGRMGTVKSDLTTKTYNEKLDQMVLSLSGEFGWRFDVTDRFFVEPSVEATYTRVTSDSYAANGNTFKVDDYDSMVARAGIAAGFKCPSNFGNVYFRAGVAHEFMGDAKFIATTAAGKSNPVEVKGKDTWFEYAIGANFNVNKNTYVYADIERTEGADVETDWRANVGVRFAF